MKRGRDAAFNEIVRFVVVGVVSTAVYACVLVGLMHFGAVSAGVAGAAAYALGTGLNYALHRAWTFQSKRSHGVAVPRYLAVHAIAMGLNTMALGVLVDVFGWPFLLGQGFGLALVFAWSYLAQKFLVFKPLPETPE